MTDTIQQDTLQRFLFENTPIRGNIVHLDQTLNMALQHQHCPPALRVALGELMVASALLAATLKMNGALVLQIQGSGALKLLVVECTADLSIRATAKWSGELPEGNFTELVGHGQFVITLDPKDGGQPYVGIVALEGNSISEILQNYMQRSEQIETRIWLACSEHTAAGMLLQKLPDQPEQDVDAWARTGFLAETVKPEELLGLSAEALLTRLFHEEDVRLFNAKPIKFHCSCSRNSVSSMLRMLGSDEVASILEEQGRIEVHCDFCNKRYEFDKVDAQQLFSGDVVPGSASRH
ncbi:MAG TPA: Hsp33 family molecular chaperone HslO [Methylophilaceae bacterium]|nr:Hsp33 family molecular chaperone HslO [Methylophilaceae bacterium]